MADHSDGGNLSFIMQEQWVGDAEIWNRMGNYTRRTVAYISFVTIHNNFLVHLRIVWCPLWHSSFFKDTKSRLLSIEVQDKTPASSLEVEQNPHFHFPHGKCTGIICHICSSEDRPFSFCQVKRFWERPFMNYIAEETVYGKLILNHWSILILFLFFFKGSQMVVPLYEFIYDSAFSSDLTDHWSGKDSHSIFHVTKK